MSARRRLLVLFLALGLGPAGAQGLQPFLPAAAPAPKILKALAPPDFIDRAAIEAFEADSGWTIALDVYASPGELGERSAEQHYDVVVLRGPAYARRLAAGGLRRLDRRRLPNARLVNPGVAAKFAAYDRDGAFGVPFGWSAFGLLYDADKARDPPVAWAQLLAKGPRPASGCGVAWPDARDESFLAVWRMMGVEPARARSADVKSAAAALERARGGFLAFAVPDEVGALAKGAACLGAGTAGDAAAVGARGGDNAPAIRFAYPREGAPLALYAFAMPADASAPDAAYRFIDALLAPDNARRDAAAAGLVGAEDATDLNELKRLIPEPVFDPGLLALMQSEWKRLTQAK